MVTATEIGFVRMQVGKVVGVQDEDRVCEFVVLNELDGDRRLLIQIGMINPGERPWIGALLAASRRLMPSSMPRLPGMKLSAVNRDGRITGHASVQGTR